MNEKENDSPETEEPVKSAAESTESALQSEAPADAENETINPSADDDLLPSAAMMSDDAIEAFESDADLTDIDADSVVASEDYAEADASEAFEDFEADADDPYAEDNAAEDTLIALENDLNDSFAPAADFDEADFDIDAALAAVAGLPALTNLPEDAQDESVPDAVADDALLPDPELNAASVVQGPARPITAPPLSRLQRGQAASVIPALLLIGLGAGLSLYLTSNDAGLSPEILLSLLMGFGGLVLLSWWMSTRRSASGAFFFGILLLLNALAIAISAQPDGLGMAGWPLSLIALGMAIFLTAIVIPRTGGRLAIIGLSIIIAAAASIALTSELIDPSLQEIAANIWPLAPALLIFFLLAPLLRRGRRS